MKWRPKDKWQNPYILYDWEANDMESRYNIFEAGADAMLETLWKLAEESPTKTFTLDANVISIYRGE